MSQWMPGFNHISPESLSFGFTPVNNLGTVTDSPFGTVGGQMPTGVTTPPIGSSGFGFNMPTLQMGIAGLQGLGNLWGAWQSNRLARDQLDFTKNITNTNLNNSIKSYNTALSDRARARAAVEGMSAADRDAYVAANSLSRG